MAVINCPHCQELVSDSASACRRCGYALRSSPDGGVKSHLTVAILTTLCCCMPFGIVAIINAARVKTKLEAGDADGAIAASERALMWSWVAACAGVLASGLYLILLLAGYVGDRP